MPNNVTTRCQVYGSPEELARFKAQMIGKEQRKNWKGEMEAVTCLDFNKAIPMPEILNDTSSQSGPGIGESLILFSQQEGKELAEVKMPDDWVRLRVKLPDKPSPEAFAIARKFLEENPEAKEEGELAIEAKKQTGYRDWYEWSVENWGTKWNSYDFSLYEEDDRPEQIEMVFNTAWDFPEGVFGKMAEMFPQLEFRGHCFEESRAFAGEFSYADGSGAFESLQATSEQYEQVFGVPLEEEEEEAED